MAAKTEILPEIEALAVHCRPPLMATDARAMWLRDWCDDLSDFPIEAIRNGIRKYRHSGQTKFPTAGQLMPLVRDGVPSDRGPAVGEWREASPEEYRAMSIRDKIREHQILATIAYGKAGPMFRNTSAGGPISKASGIHLKAEDMPDSHRRWTEEGKRHAAEATRLRQFLNQEPRQATR